MNIKFLCYALCLTGLSFAPAMQAQEVLPEYTQARKFAPSNAEQWLFSYTVTPHYFKGSPKFWYDYKTSDGTRWYVVDPDSRKKQELFDRDELAARLSEITQEPFAGQQLKLKELRLSDDDRTFTFTLKGAHGNYLFAYDYQSQALKQIEKSDLPVPNRWANISPDKQRVVYAKDLNLYTMSYADFERLQKDPKAEGLQETALTTDGEPHFGFGMPRNIMSGDTLLNHKRKYVGGNWSPDGRYFVATLTDQRAVKELWVVHNTAKPRPTLETYKYQMPGEAGSPITHLYLFDLQQGQRKEIKTDRFKDQVISLATKPDKLNDGDDQQSVWLGDNETFYLTRTSRDMKRIDICAYTMGQDSIRPLIEERMKTSMESRPLALTENGKEMIQWSERDGWAHLYLYDNTGKLKNRITKGAWHVNSIVEVDSKSRVVYFIANGREKDDTTPYYEHLYRVNFDGSGLKLVTPGNYFHLTSMDRQGRYVVDNYSRVNTVPATALYDNQGNKLMTLEESDFSQLKQAGYQFPEPFQVKAADGVTDLYGVMFKPFDFDSTKVYPVINYVYPGPQTEGTFFRYIPLNPRTDRLAQAGFIVVCVGHRGGHPSRSKWYHNYGYGNLRDYPMADHKAAIEQLCAQHPYMDINRVGIHGHSGGGFMSTAAMLLYPDFFKVAVSCAGNHDNNIYNRWWGEKHHGVEEVTDEQGETTFKSHIPTNQELAKNLKGHLLLVHGDVDNNVHPANTTVVVDALIKAGKRFDMLFIPGQRHHFEEYNEYLYWRMVDYFSEHLKGQREQSIDIKDLKLGNWFQGYQ